MSVERAKSWLPSMFYRSKHASRQKDVMKKLKDNLRCGTRDRSWDHGGYGAGGYGAHVSVVHPASEHPNAARTLCTGTSTASHGLHAEAS